MVESQRGMLTTLWILLIVLALALTAVLFVRHELFTPHVTFTILPLYALPDGLVIAGVMVQNRGHGPAFDCKIDVRYDPLGTDKIENLHVSAPPDYVLRGGGQGYSFVTLRLPELDAGEEAVIYMAGTHAAAPKVEISLPPS